MLASNYQYQVTFHKSKDLAPVCGFLCDAAVRCVVISVEPSIFMFRVEVIIE
jgi:hypothetical protein